jgi:hypothetical protein
MAIFSQFLGPSPFTSVEKRSIFMRCPGKRSERVVGNGAVGHGAEHDRCFELNARIFYVLQFPVLDLEVIGSSAQESPKLHGLSQRVNGRVRDLGCIYQYMVPIVLVRFVGPHTGQQNTTCFGLLLQVLDVLAGPVGVGLVCIVVVLDDQGVRGAKYGAALTGNTVFFPVHHDVTISVIPVDIEGALPFAHTALNAPVLVPLYSKFRK